ncbi:MAG TPA: ABC transporter ATP-binding protein [Bacillota bacterium]
MNRPDSPTAAAGAAAPVPGDLLVMEDIVAGYVPGVDILQGVSLTVRQGELVSIIGPNGAGKSTLLKTLMGLLRPRRGSIRFRGTELAGLKPSDIVGLGISYVPQVRNVFPNLTVKENLEIAAALAGTGAPGRIERIFTLFPDLKDKARQKAGTLSGGQRQMLAMGRALILDPSLLVLDEPSAGLAPQMVSTVFEKVAEINEQGCTILMIEQNARRALEMSDRGYVLDMGRNAVDDTGRALLNNPQVVELYLGKIAQEHDG